MTTAAGAASRRGSAELRAPGAGFTAARLGPPSSAGTAGATGIRRRCASGADSGDDALAGEWMA